MSSYKKFYFYIKGEFKLSITSFYLDAMLLYCCRETRELSGVSLLHEYISVANAQLPRRLQNLGHERRGDRQKRLLKALTLARSLLVDANPKNYFENGIRKRVKGTEYSELNVRKYIVKIYTKLMKYQPNPIGKFIVRDECNKVKRLAVKNIFFYTSPSILIQVNRIVS